MPFLLLAQPVDVLPRPVEQFQKMQWWAIPVVAIISFILLGLEEVGKELENPFLYGFNDLPVDALCNNLIGDVESIANFSSEEFLSLTPKEPPLVVL